MGRLRLPVSRTLAVSLDGGVTTGSYKDRDCAPFDCQSSARRVWEPAVWGNIGASVEFRTANGFHIRTYLGSAALLNPNDYVCRDDSGAACELGPPETPHQLIYFGVALGYAFDL